MAQFLSWSLLNDVVHQINHPCAFPKIPFIPHKEGPILRKEAILNLYCISFYFRIRRDLHQKVRFQGRYGLGLNNRKILKLSWQDVVHIKCLQLYCQKCRRAIPSTTSEYFKRSPPILRLDATFVLILNLEKQIYSKILQDHIHIAISLESHINNLIKLHRTHYYDKLLLN